MYAMYNLVFGMNPTLHGSLGSQTLARRYAIVHSIPSAKKANVLKGQVLRPTATVAEAYLHFDGFLG